MHVLTANTFGTAESELRNIRCKLHIIRGGDQDIKKAQLVKELGPERTVSIGNGMNDRQMLKLSSLGICVIGSEGSSTQAIEASDICVKDIRDALDLLLNPERIIATLRLS